MVEELVGFAENLQPVALIGAGGIGKTSIALTVLHHNRVEERFGENRRFIRCDQFPPSRAHFLARLSKAIGAGIENHEDLTPLRPFLTGTSKETFIVLDNAESILDPQGTDAREIYSVVEELCRFKKISLIITSRILTITPHCKRPEIPTLSIEAACDIFYDIYGNHEKSSIINNLFQRLDCHPLSITLLATAASHNAWDHNRLAKEWDAQRARVLRTNYHESLAATIELSLTSPTFRSLDPHARDLLGVVAFFPRGIDENNLDWLFPTISNPQLLFDTFCKLSLTYRNNGFVTMLAPIREYFVPQDPLASPLLCATRNHYFSRLSVEIYPDRPGFGEARWVMSEDANVEHLLDVFTSTDPNPGDVWDACYYFMKHLSWHKPQHTALRLEIEALPDDHPSKSKCLLELSRLLREVGSNVERKRLLTLTLELERRRGSGPQLAITLRYLSDVNRIFHHTDEGIRQAKEALEIFERIGDIREQAMCLYDLAFLFTSDSQLDAAENTASRAIDLITKKSQEYIFSKLHWVLGNVYRYKGEKEKAVHHFETTLRIASPFDWHGILFWTHRSLAWLFHDGDELDDTNAHIEQTKSHAVDGAMVYQLGGAMEMQANVWYRQGRLGEAKSEVLAALEIFEKLGVAKHANNCRHLLQEVEQAMQGQSALPQVGFSNQHCFLRLLIITSQSESDHLAP